jgi:hypothetical protein
MNVDIAFALDCTGSMQPWIDAAKHQIHRTITELRDLHTSSRMRVAVVLYRDFGDTFEHGWKHFRTLGFVEETQIITQLLEETHAEGGNDTAEDIEGALEKVNSLNWDPDAIKHCFLITDAPPHGRDWHEVHISDRYPDVGAGLVDQIKQLDNNRVHFTIMKVNRSVNILLKRASDIYEPTRFHVEDIVNQMLAIGPPTEAPGHTTVMETPDTSLSRMISLRVTRSMDPTTSYT